MRIERLRLSGFKSFADRTELPIEPGLTGIVGPNGCGKSNLADALRWVMGESSARRVRGGAMDDVIFAGAAGRPAANIAEIALVLDNSERDAPLAVNDSERIEIVRRIERNGGSVYRVNGREARARDVQLLFADAAAGAQSSAIVSQGRITALIEARPAERRLLLEEAAGIAGLQTRRQETEQRLGAAEDNLLRLDDVMATLAARLQSLGRQVRQAQRYRRLGDEIRRLQTQLLLARWHAAGAAAERAAADLTDAEGAVTMAAAQAEAARTRLEAAEAALPARRREAAENAAERERLLRARAALERELQQSVAGQAEMRRRLDQLAADIGREDEHGADATTALTALESERRALKEADTAEKASAAAAVAMAREAASELADAEAALQRATEAVAGNAVRRSALEQRGRDLEARRARLQVRVSEAERELNAAAAAQVPPVSLQAAGRELQAAERRATTARQEFNEIEPQIAAAAAEERRALDVQRQAAAAYARLAAEADALTPAPTASASHEREPLLARISVAAGYETAIGAAFDDELGAAIAEADEPAGDCCWFTLPSCAAPRLPEGAYPLAAFIAAPPVLDRRLAFTGWVENAALGRALQPRLLPGQQLVDRDGRLWRWDGFSRARPAVSTASRALQQQNRLAELRPMIAGAAAELADAEAAFAAARARRGELDARERRLRESLRAAETALSEARKREAELARRALAADSRGAAIGERMAALQAEKEDLAVAADRLAGELAALPADDAHAGELVTARQRATAARQRERDALAACEQLRREAAERHRRLTAIDGEIASWRARAERSRLQQGVLAERRAAAEAELAELTARPGAIARETGAVSGALAAATQASQRAADALTAAETDRREANDAARSADLGLAAAREKRVREKATHDRAAEMLAEIENEVRARLEEAPAALAQRLGAATEAGPAEMATAQARLDRLTREREAIGPVNLVAEREAAELEAQLAEMRRERTELTEAIERLRRGVAALDREGRQRLTAALERLNGHFEALFVRLFGGGKAELALVGDGDPLAAGLDVLVTAPGKRRQPLSLLSGGEQALTALALVFAVFLTNPAPVCVLDEVDAPLDDANIDRFCQVIAEIADTAVTRFLVMTHHRITMARVDRLFGVTMAEDGVSQLVSVDFSRAARLRQTA
jgi:chromosome segregation protein